MNLYIHIPFCKSKCSYCDFYSIADEDKLIDKYSKYLCKELELLHRQNTLNQLSTLYIGGGTPSVLSSNQLEYTLSYLNTLFSFIPDYEFTIELNPVSITKQKLNILKQYNVNRLSIGIQSFNDSVLKYLNRPYSVNELQKNLDIIFNHDFNNINFDFIFGNIPEQNIIHDLNNALKYYPQHLSIYNLDLNTSLALYQKYKSNPFKESDTYFKISEFLYAKKYIHYEISNFAKQNLMSKHNCNYWNNNNYYGCGIAAVSCYNKKRYYNTKNFDDYFNYIDNNTLPISRMETLSHNDLLNEYIMLHFRTKNGIDKRQFKNRFGDDTYNNLIQKINENYLYDYFIIDANKIILKRKCWFKYNSIVSELFN